MENNDIDSILNGEIAFSNSHSEKGKLAVLSQPRTARAINSPETTPVSDQPLSQEHPSENQQNINEQTEDARSVVDPKKPKKLRRKSSGQQDIPASVRPNTAETSSSGLRQFSKHRYSLATMERSIAAKIYFENYFDKLFNGRTASPNASLSRTRRRIMVEQELDRLGLSDAEKSRVRQQWLSHERILTRVSRQKMTSDMFTPIKPLGKGAFGLVQLVRENETNTIYAMKILRKEDMLKENHESHVRAERDMLSEAASNESCKWLVKLICSFQDFNHLYLVMEYLPGGDLLSLLIQYDTFSEDMAKFYAAEMILCIEETHKLGYVHRDIKPDNFLIDGRGHLRLGDCGLATDFHWSHETGYYEAIRKHAYAGLQVEDGDGDLGGEEHDLDEYITSTEQTSEAFLKDHESSASSDIKYADNVFVNVPPSHKILTWRSRRPNHSRTFSVVGTNNYIAPEVLKAKNYDYGCDWWSLGVIIFEMLYGYPPFASRTREGTRMKILEWQKWLKFPSFVTRKNSHGYSYAGEVGREVKDLIKKLLCSQEERIGASTILKPQIPIDQLVSREGTPNDFSTVITIMMLGKDSAEIKKHPWFKDVDFNRLIESNPPWTPDIKGEDDTKYFDQTVKESGIIETFQEFQKVQKPEPSTQLEPVKASQDSSEESSPNVDEEDPEILDLRKRLAFKGFTYKGSAAIRAELLKTSKLE